jgi:hypothetical protein
LHVKRLLAGAVVAIPRLVHAEEPPPSPPDPHAAPAAVGAVWIGAGVGIVGGAGVVATRGGQPANFELSTGVALHATFDYQLTSYLAVGAMPRFVFGTEAKGTDDSFRMLDVLARVTLGAPLVKHVRVYGFGAFGYSIIFPPSPSPTYPNDPTRPTGPTFTVGAGATYALQRDLRLFGELGYDFGYQAFARSGHPFEDFHVHFYSGSVGVAMAFGG